MQQQSEKIGLSDSLQTISIQIYKKIDVEVFQHGIKKGIKSEFQQKKHFASDLQNACNR